MNIHNKLSHKFIKYTTKQYIFNTKASEDGLVKKTKKKKKRPTFRCRN